MSIYDINPNDESLKVEGNNFLKFGLNRGKIKHVGLKEGSGNSGNWKAIELEVSINDKIFKSMMFIGGKFFDENAQIQLIATLKHIMKATGVTDAMIKAKIDEMGLTEFSEEGVKGLLSIIPKRTVEVDVFLEYQYIFRNSDQKQTFLELPNNMKSGYWIIPSTEPVKWKEVLDDKGLHYEDDKGNIHKFTRNDYFMKGNKANKQLRDSEASESKSNTSYTKDDEAWD